MLARFERYKDTRRGAPAQRPQSEAAPATSERVRQSVHAFVLNGYGEACFNYFLRSGDKRSHEQAEDAYKRARECNPAYVLPHYNLCLLEIDRDNYEAATECIDDALKLEPDWPDAVLMKVIVSADLVAMGRPEAERQARIELEARREAAALRGRADELERSLSSTWAVLGAEVTGADVGITPARSAELRKEAGALERRADGARAQAERLRRQTGKAGRESVAALSAPIRKLVPHPWLWAEGGRARRRRSPGTSLGAQTSSVTGAGSASSGTFICVPCGPGRSRACRWRPIRKSGHGSPGCSSSCAGASGPSSSASSPPVATSRSTTASTS